MNKREFMVAALLVTVTVAFRIINTQNHLVNFAPLLALSLFAGSIFSNKALSFGTALIAALLGDLYIGMFTSQPGYYGLSQLFTYASYILVVALGTQLKKPSVLKVLGFAVCSSLIFFIVSNLGVWLDTTYNLYPKTANGLIACFTAAIAFYRQQVEANFIFNPLTADAIYAAFFFGLSYTLYKLPNTKKAIA